MKFREQISEEMYEEALKGAEKIYDRAVSEPKRPDAVGDLIHKQVEEVADYLAASVRSRQGGDLNSCCLFLEEACARMFQVVQNLQNEIEALQADRKETDAILHGLVMNPDGMRQMVDDVKGRILG